MLETAACFRAGAMLLLTYVLCVLYVLCMLCMQHVLYVLYELYELHVLHVLNVLFVMYVLRVCAVFFNVCFLPLRRGMVSSPGIVPRLSTVY